MATEDENWYAALKGLQGLSLLDVSANALLTLALPSQDELVAHKLRAIGNYLEAASAACVKSAFGASLLRATTHHTQQRSERQEALLHSLPTCAVHFEHGLPGAPGCD